MSDNRINSRPPTSQTDDSTSAQPSPAPLGVSDAHSSSTIRSPGLPQLEIVGLDGRPTIIQANQARSSEAPIRSTRTAIGPSSASAISPSSATRPPPHSILHNSSSSSNKTPRSQVGDLSHADDGTSNTSSRKSRSVSFRDDVGGRQPRSVSNDEGEVDEFVSSRLKKSDTPIVSSWIASQNQNAVASSSRPPIRLDPTPDFLNPANAPLDDDDDFEAFRPQTPDLAFDVRLPGATPPATSNPVPTAAATGAARADTRNSNTTGAQLTVSNTGFQMEAIAPSFNERLARPATPAGVASPPGMFLTADARTTSGNQERRADHQGERGRGRGRGSLAGDVYEPRRPTREEEVRPLKHANAARHNYPPNRYASPRRRVPKRSPDRPFKVFDPYSFPKNQKKSPIPPLIGAVKWAITAAEEWLGVDTSGSGEGSSDTNTNSTSSTLNGKGKGPKHPNGDLEHGVGAPETVDNGAKPPHIVPNRTMRVVQPTSSSRRDFRRTRPLTSVTREAVAAETMHPADPDSRRNLELVRRIHDARTLELKLETQRVELTRERARLEEERTKFLQEKGDVEHGRPGATPVQHGAAAGSSKPQPAEHSPSVAGSAPAGHIPGHAPNEHATLSPPKASPDNRPGSDPVSPTQRQAPFDFDFNVAKGLANVRDVEVMVENTLRKYLRDIVIQVYRHLLLRMPSMYSHRVERVLEQAHLSEAEVQILIKIDNENGRNSAAGRILDTPARYALDDFEERVPLIGRDNSASNSPYQPSIFKSLLDNPQDLENGLVPIDPATLGDRNVHDIGRKVKYFQTEWETFVDGLVREWKTLNVVNALLIGALLTIFQIEEAQYVPSTRTCALISLSTALLSLLFGGIYIIRFGSMRPLRKAIIWVDESQKQTQTALWNIWVMLALPGIWLGYSIMAFIATILSFVWTSGNGKHVNPPSASDTDGVILAPRIIISTIFLIGAIYFIAALGVFARWKGVSMRAADRRPPGSLPGSVENTPGHRSLEYPNEVRPLDSTVLGIPRAGSSAPSALGLELSPGGATKPPIQPSPAFTATPPMMTSAELAGFGQGPVTTIVTQPTPLTAVDPSTSWGRLVDPILPSQKFQLRDQTNDLDQPLPLSSRQASAPTMTTGSGTPRASPRGLPPVREESAGF